MDAMNPADYRPQYDDTVYEFLPGLGAPVSNIDARWPINPAYCLTLPSAVILRSFWSTPPAIVNMPPIPQAPNSPFAFSHLVPWFRFGDGTLRNAALLAGYWGNDNGPMPGVPYASALDYAKIDVSTPVEG